MKRVSFLGYGIFAIIIIFTLAFLLPGGMIFPMFGNAPTCADARVTIYNGDYNPLKQEVSLLIKNGPLALELESYVMDSGGLWKHGKRIFISAKGEGTFTLDGVKKTPVEVTVTSVECRKASDLWKKF